MQNSLCTYQYLGLRSFLLGSTSRLPGTMLSSLKSENTTFVPYKLDVLCLELRTKTLRDFNNACKEHQKETPFYLLIIYSSTFLDLRVSF
jgi:hypothetical protein